EAPALWLLLVRTRPTDWVIHSTRLRLRLCSCGSRAMSSPRRCIPSPAVLSGLCLVCSTTRLRLRLCSCGSRAMSSPRRCIPSPTVLSVRLRLCSCGSRAMSSPRRCIPHQQSCLGNTAFCYCCRITRKHRLYIPGCISETGQ
uniref:Uncharacterized protein n=1 Tax=Oncorhynchus mykiss TaxID=8022 RepID=A0A8K9XWX2_ONCMY